MSAGPGNSPDGKEPASAGQASGAAPSVVVDQAVTAADGTRATARWIASSLGAIPSLAVLASIVRAPGDSGFDPGILALGVALAALGAVIGVLGFAWVAVPVPLEDKDLRTLDLRRIPGQPYTSFSEFNETLNKLRAAGAQLEFQAAEAQGDADSAKAAAGQSEATAKTAAEKAAAAPGDTTLRDAAAEARTAADRADAAASEKAAMAAAESASAATWLAQVSRRDSIRRDAYQLKASDVVRSRFKDACWGSVLAVGLIAAGVVLLGLAPKANPAPAPAPARLSLVTLKLSTAGQHALGCTAKSLQALRTGGTASAPAVITLPVPGCPSRAVVFTTVSRTALGKVAASHPAGR